MRLGDYSTLGLVGYRGPLLWISVVDLLLNLNTRRKPSDLRFQHLDILVLSHRVGKLESLAQCGRQSRGPFTASQPVDDELWLQSEFRSEASAGSGAWPSSSTLRKKLDSMICPPRARERAAGIINRMALTGSKSPKCCAPQLPTA
jgi:hypothetical protein